MIERITDKQKPCAFCTQYGHTQWKCPGRPRKPLQSRKALSSRSTLRTTKPMNKIGKVQKKTQSAVDKWKRTQKPTHQGYYYCYISGKPVPYLMAEHPYSKTRHPELRTDQIFEPVSAEINALKGSLDISDFLEKYPQYKATVKKRYL